MPTFRLVSGFLFAPWVPVLAYYLAYSALFADAAGGPPSVTAFIAILIPVAYAATALAWLPFVFVLHRFGKNGFLSLAMGGVAMGVIVGAAGLVFGGEPVIDQGSVTFLILAAVIGISFGVAFWAIALAGSDDSVKA